MSYKTSFFMIGRMSRMSRIRNKIDPTYEYINVEYKEDYECPICLDELYSKDENGEIRYVIKLKSCSHLFHEDCFKKYNKKICPMCRRDITKYEEKNDKDTCILL